MYVRSTTTFLWCVFSFYREWRIVSAVRCYYMVTVLLPVMAMFLDVMIDYDIVVLSKIVW